LATEILTPQFALICLLFIFLFILISHDAFITAGEWGLLPDYRHWQWRYGIGRSSGSSRLFTEVWGHKFNSPVGVAAGLDKNAKIIDPLYGLGMSTTSKTQIFVFSFFPLQASFLTSFVSFDPVHVC
jgi:hypothetical protein